MPPVMLLRVPPSAPPARPSATRRSFRRGVAAATVALLAAGLLVTTSQAAQADPSTTGGIVAGWGASWNQQTDVPSSLADKTVTAITAGDLHSLALTSDGHVTAWGYNGQGQTDVPTSLADKTVTAIAAGRYHSLALTSDGHVTAWGYNGQGQAEVPTSLADKTVTAITAGGYHSLALTSDGHVTAWGYNQQGQTDVPTSLADQTVTAIAAGESHSLALTSDGHLTAWGSNGEGQTDLPTSLADKTVTAITAGSYHSLAIYNAPVAATVTGLPSVTGTPTVGETLTGDVSEVATTPTGATPSYQWLRDDAPITDATATTYTMTNDDAGHTITFQVGATADGYNDATPVTSEAVGPVDGGQITLPLPSITGTPVVDGTLSATLPEGLAPSDASVTWQWYRGQTPVGDGSSYTPVADDVDHVLTVTATATMDHFDEATRSTDTDSAVTPASFVTGPSASITGTGKVGETLTAGAGGTAPTPSDTAYQWYADDEVIEGATDATLLLGPAQRHTTITVKVTATRAGYDDASDTSEPLADIATDLAPDVFFEAKDATLRRGQTTALEWDTLEATTVTALGAWTGSKATSGSVTVGPTVLGTTTYVVEATNANGTTTSQVSIVVTRPRVTLGVTALGGLRLAGRILPITVRGLEAGEHYSITTGGVEVATGTAGPRGDFARFAMVPAGTREGSVPIVVTGDAADRTGGAVVTVVRPKALGLRVAKHVVRTRHRQDVTVTGLAAGEPVTVAYRGKRVSPADAHADRSGIYRTVIRVGRLQGSKLVRATGAFAERTATTRFLVRNR